MGAESKSWLDCANPRLMKTTVSRLEDTWSSRIRMRDLGGAYRPLLAELSERKGKGTFYKQDAPDGADEKWGSSENSI